MGLLSIFIFPSYNKRTILNYSCTWHLDLLNVMILLNQHLLSRAPTVLNGESEDQKMAEIEIEKFTAYRSWRICTTWLKGPHEEVKVGYRQKE